MTGYFLYFLLAVGLSILFTASFRRLRSDGSGSISSREDVDFERKMADIEKEVSGKRGGEKNADGKNE